MNHTIKTYFWIASQTESNLSNFIPSKSRILGVVANGGESAGPPAGTAAINIRFAVAGISICLIALAGTAEPTTGNSLIFKWAGNDNEFHILDDAQDPSTPSDGGGVGGIPAGLPLRFPTNLGTADVTVQVTIANNGVLGAVWYTDDAPNPASQINL